MPLTALSKTENLEKSLNAFVTSALVTGEGIQVDFPGDKTIFTPSGARWIKVDYILGMSRRFMGSVRNAGERGNLVSGIVNINCCELVAQRTNRYALAALRDAVVFRVRQGISIPVRDYDTAGSPVVGYFAVLEVTEAMVSDGFGANDLGIATWNVSAAGDYVEIV